MLPKILEEDPNTFRLLIALGWAANVATSCESNMRGVVLHSLGALRGICIKFKISVDKKSGDEIKC